MQIAKTFEKDLINQLKDVIANKRLTLKESSDNPQIVQKAIQSITNKMKQSKISELHPPYLSKTITKFRHQYFLQIKKQYSVKINSKNEKDFLDGIALLKAFVVNLDCQYFDLYLQQIRQPYVRKIFSENYEFGQLDFKEINNQYKIRTEIQNFLNSASEWLIQIQRTQDLLERVEIYFDVKTPTIIEKMKREGIQENKNNSWYSSISSMIRNVTSYTLRKSSKIISSTFFTAVAPSMAMLTFAIIGGSATLPWKSDLNAKLLFVPLMAISVPYALDSLASSIEKNQFIKTLQDWAISLEKIGNSICKFNEEVEAIILSCVEAKTQQQYVKGKINLQKYTKSLDENISNVINFNQQSFQEMKNRTEAYFKKYVQIQEGDWTIVIPEQQMPHLYNQKYPN